ncbi:hypothetical protein GF345_03885 [Candidatus Woesearchaeota archaeon]|nr:hypothetical protein [Candidatus Woesearchaeota archaeon]
MWFGNGIIWNVSDVMELVQDPKFKGRTLPLKEIISTIHSSRSSANSAERQFIDRYIREAAGMMLSASESSPYGTLRVSSEEEWQRDYAASGIMLVLEQARRAFSLNGDGIDAITAYDGGWSRDVPVSNLAYDPGRFSILQQGGRSINWPHGRGTIEVDLGTGKDKRYSLDLEKLYNNRICPSREACPEEQSNIDAACYSGGFEACPSYSEQMRPHDGK